MVCPMADLIKRPELDYDILALIDPERPELREDHQIPGKCSD